MSLTAYSIYTDVLNWCGSDLLTLTWFMHHNDYSPQTTTWLTFPKLENTTGWLCAFRPTLIVCQPLKRMIHHGLLSGAAELSIIHTSKVHTKTYYGDVSLKQRHQKRLHLRHNLFNVIIKTWFIWQCVVDIEELCIVKFCLQEIMFNDVYHCPVKSGFCLFCLSILVFMVDRRPCRSGACWRTPRGCTSSLLNLHFICS